MKSNKSKLVSIDGLLFVLLIAATVFIKAAWSPVVYSLFLLTTLTVFFFSQEDWFWLAYVFVLTFVTGGLLGTSPERFSFLSYEISYYIIFSVVAFVKAKSFAKKKLSPNPFNSYIYIWLFYGIYILFYGVIAFGVADYPGESGYRFYYTILTGIVVSLYVFSVPRLFATYSDMIKFGNLFFILVYINLFGQIFYLLNGVPFFYHIGIASESISPNENYSSVFYLVRPEFGSNLRFIALFLALFFYLSKEPTPPKNYLLFTIFVILLSTFITGTRGWIIAFSLIMAFTSLLINRRLLWPIFVSLFLFFIIYQSSEYFRIQTDMVIQRMLTLESIADGDLTADGTLKRLTDRSRPLLDIFRKHPLIGIGISGKSLLYADEHVGVQSILMSEGILGVSLYLVFFIYIFYMVWKIYSSLSATNPYKTSILIIIPIFLGLITIHSTSQAFFGWVIYLIRTRQLLFLVLLFQTMALMLNQAVAANKRQQGMTNVYKKPSYT